MNAIVFILAYIGAGALAATLLICAAIGGKRFDRVARARADVDQRRDERVVRVLNDLGDEASGIEFNGGWLRS